jgi:hypothetical protein
MKKVASLARRLSRVSAAEKAAKPIEITDIIEGAQCTAAYIAQLTGELATLANGARFANLAWPFSSPGLSSKPSFGRVKANEDRHVFSCAQRRPRKRRVALASPLPRQERWIVPSALCSPKSFIFVGAGSRSAGC